MKAPCRGLWCVGGLLLGLACSGLPLDADNPVEQAPPAPPPEAKPSSPRGTGVWVYDEERAATVGAERLEAPFDRLAAPCELSHEGAGGTGRAWHPDSECGLTRAGFRMKGQWTSICFGVALGEHPPWCDPEDDSDNETVDQVIPVTRGKGCAVRFGDHPFIQIEGCRR